jgi:hypothetical protein
VTDPVKPRARRIVFRANTTGDSSENDIVVPAQDSAADPTVAGAWTSVYNSSGLSADVFQVRLETGGWSVIGPKRAAQPKGYRFKSNSGPIRSVSVKSHRIVIRGGRAPFTYTLDEAAQGSVAIRLTLGTGVTWCADAGRPPFVETDRAGRFETAPGAPVPAACP